MSSNHLVTAGCSFTISDGDRIGNGNKSWARHLDDKLEDVEVHNVGMSGVGNYVISMNCIHIVQNLLDYGINSDDINVIIQWSGLYRPTLYSEIESHCDLPFTEIRDEFYTLDNVSNNSGEFINTAGQIRRENPFWMEYFEKYFGTGNAFVHTLDCILKTQWYLTSKKIKYKMFNSWDTFTTSEKSNFFERILGSGDKGNQHGRQIYKNKNNRLYKDVYPYSTHMWDMIDWDNFWTFDNENVKFGGMLQWTQNTQQFKDWYVAYGEDFHVPTQSSLKFTEEVILPWLKKL